MTVLWLPFLVKPSVPLSLRVVVVVFDAVVAASIIPYQLPLL